MSEENEEKSNNKDIYLSTIYDDDDTCNNLGKKEKGTCKEWKMDT